MDIVKIPKIELHCHLDGSIRVETVIDIARKENIKLPTYNLNELEKMLKVEDDCKSLNQYLEKFCIPNKVMQSKESLKRVTFELLEDCAHENIKYIEVRFAPSLHKENGLDTEEIVESVLDGMRDAENKYEIKSNLIICCMRSMGKEESSDVILKASKYINKGVVAVDLCGVEKEGFSSFFKEPIDLAKQLGYEVTIHAGEAASGKNVEEAIEILGAKRIGHGIRTKENKKAYELAKKRGIVFEMCPTSNIQTKAINTIENHPIYEFYKDNMLITINTDNRTVSNINLSNEINVVIANFNINMDDYKVIYTNAVNASFASKDIKKWLKELI